MMKTRPTSIRVAAGDITIALGDFSRRLTSLWSCSLAAYRDRRPVAHASTHRLPIRLACLSASLLTGGCGRPAPPIHLIEAYNTSGSFRPHLADAVSDGVRLDAILVPDRDRLTLLRFDSDTREFARGPLGGDPEELQSQVLAEIGPPARHDNTYTEQLWQRVLEQARTETLPVVVVLHHDGFSEGTPPVGHRAIKAYATQLAALPQLRAVILLGVQSQARAELDADLAPLRDRLGDAHFLICGAHNTDLSPVLAQIDNARQPKGGR